MYEVVLLGESTSVLIQYRTMMRTGLMFMEYLQMNSALVAKSKGYYMDYASLLLTRTSGHALSPSSDSLAKSALRP